MRRHPTVAFVILAYAVSWIVTVPLITGAIPEGFHLLVALGPTVAAVVVTSVISGRSGLTALWDRIHDWRRFPSIWWWLISVSPLGFLVIGVSLAAITGNLPDSIDWQSDFDDEGWLIGLVGASLFFGIFEEIGWRGFLLPRLQLHHTASRASLILWLIWTGWHLPMFVYHFDFDPFFIVGWFVSLYFGTVLLTCLLNNTYGSLLAVILFHVSLNLASIFGEVISAVTTAAVSVLVILATIVLARWGGPADLSRHGRFTIDDASVR